MIENNNETPVQEEKPKCLCETCQYFMIFGVNPHLKVAVGPCTNDKHEAAPFGIVVSHFATCSGYVKREAAPRIAIPKKIVSRLG